MRRNALVALSATLGVGLVGCEILEEFLTMDALNLLGIMPKADFSRAEARDFGKVVFAVGAQDDGGFSLAPPVSMLEFRDEQGALLAVAEEQAIPGADAGSFALGGCVLSRLADLRL